VLTLKHSQLYSQPLTAAALREQRQHANGAQTVLIDKFTERSIVLRIKANIKREHFLARCMCGLTN
jgi:hypothetical protein